MRPACEIREALRGAAERLVQQCGNQASPGLTYLDLAPAAGVGYEAARRTVWNMAKAGELLPVGTKAVPGIKRPLTAFVPVAVQPRAKRRITDPSQALASAMRGFVGAF